MKDKTKKRSYVRKSVENPTQNIQPIQNPLENVANVPPQAEIPQKTDEKIARKPLPTQRIVVEKPKCPACSTIGTEAYTCIQDSLGRRIRYYMCSNCRQRYKVFIESN